MTYEEIEAKRDELEKRMNEEGYTDEIREAWNELNDEEMANEMENAYAIARNGKVTFFIVYMYECGYAIHSKIDGEWKYNDGYTATKAMREFCKLARENNVEMCLVSPKWLDREYLEELDRKFYEWREQEEYADACMASSYGDNSLMERYERSHGIEKEYSPSNPWDAPGMSVHDFI